MMKYGINRKRDVNCYWCAGNIRPGDWCAIYPPERTINEDGSISRVVQKECAHCCEIDRKTGEFLNVGLAWAP